MEYCRLVGGNRMHLLYHGIWDLSRNFSHRVGNETEWKMHNSRNINIFGVVKRCILWYDLGIIGEKGFFLERRKKSLAYAVFAYAKRVAPMASVLQKGQVSGTE